MSQISFMIDDKKVTEDQITHPQIREAFLASIKSISDDFGHMECLKHRKKAMIIVYGLDPLRIYDIRFETCCDSFQRILRGKLNKNRK